MLLAFYFHIFRGVRHSRGPGPTSPTFTLERIVRRPLAASVFSTTQTDDSFIVSPDHLTSLFVPFLRLIVFSLAAPRTGRPDSVGSYHAFSAVRILCINEIRMQKWEAEIAINRINDGMNVLVRGRTLKR